MQWSRLKRTDSTRDTRLASRIGLRGLACVLAAGLLFQAAPGGCEAQISQAIQGLVQDVGQGIGKGVTSLAEAFVLNLFI